MEWLHTIVEVYLSQRYLDGSFEVVGIILCKHDERREGGRAANLISQWLISYLADIVAISLIAE